MTTQVMAAALATLLLAFDPVSLLTPGVRLSPSEQRALEHGETIAKTLPSRPGEVAVVAVSRIDATGETLIEHTRAIESLKRSGFVTAIRRFSNPPVLSDLDGLVLSPRDVDAVLNCRIGSCSFKLTADEIMLLATHQADSGLDPRERAQRAFRAVVMARVTTYLGGGLRAVPPIVNRGSPFSLDRIFGSLAAASPALPGDPSTTDWLNERAVPDAIESFLYWSQETYGTGKPVVAVTHVGLVPPLERNDTAMVLGKQVFASRYLTGGLALTAVSSDPATGDRYLVYVNRTGVDLLGGFLGPFKRAVIESKLKREVPVIVEKLRRRLERQTR
jgi:hypothetical protein